MHRNHGCLPDPMMTVLEQGSDIAKVFDQIHSAWLADHVMGVCGCQRRRKRTLPALLPRPVKLMMLRYPEFFAPGP